MSLPSCIADLEVLVDGASCSLLLMAPMSVFLSSGSPTTSERMRCLSLRITSSYTPSSTKRRLPAQHTWPWLK
jgi:hypothetical protein